MSEPELKTFDIPAGTDRPAWIAAKRFHTLLHAHDHVARATGLDLPAKTAACNTIWLLMIEGLRERPCAHAAGIRFGFDMARHQKVAECATCHAEFGRLDDPERTSADDLALWGVVVGSRWERARKATWEPTGPPPSIIATNGRPQQ